MMPKIGGLFQRHVAMRKIRDEKIRDEEIFGRLTRALMQKIWAIASVTAL
jgi:hypothetical protein